MFSSIDNYLKIQDKNLDILTKYKLRFSLIFSICFLLFITTTIVPKVLFMQYIGTASVICSILGSLILHTILRLPHAKGVKSYRLVLILSAIFLIPLFAYEIKTNSWALITWLIILFKCVRFEFNFKFAFIITVTNAASIIFGMFFTESINPLIASVPLRIYLHFIPPILFIMTMDLFESLLRDDLLKEIRDKEEIHTIDNMITTLKHEINNPLTLSMASLYRIKKNSSTKEKDIQACENGLIRIQKLVNDMSILKEHRQKVQLSHSTMYDLKGLKKMDTTDK